MFNIISSFCEKGSASVNEDAIFVSDNCLAVIDGATGLNNIHLTSSDSDAAYLSNRLSELLNESNLDDIPATLKEAAFIIKQELDALGYDLENSYPSAGIAIAKINDDMLDCYTLGDPLILLKHKNSAMISIQDKSLVELDDLAINKMIELHEKTGCSIFKARQQINDLLIENRLKMNTPDGYYIFDPTGVGIDYINYFSIPVEDVKSIALMTDGFYAVQFCYNIVEDNKELLNLLLNNKIDFLIDKLKELSYNDDNLNIYPRFKVMDDVSIIVSKISVR